MLRKDIFIAILVGILASFLWVPTISRLLDHGRETVWLLVVIPLSFGAGVVVGAWLAQWRPFFHRLAKFAMVGILNSGIDFAIFNAFLYETGVHKGPELIGFKSVAFIAALVNSYFWNRYWVFGANDPGERQKEFASFIGVTIAGFLINVGVTTALANSIAPPFGLGQIGLDNLAAGAATILNLLWNFMGYHVVVFKPKEA